MRWPCSTRPSRTWPRWPGDPVADAEAAVAADDSLVLGHIYRAYLAAVRDDAGGRRRRPPRSSSSWTRPSWASGRPITCARPGPGPTATGRPPPARWSGPCCAIRATCSRSRWPRISTSSSATGSSCAIAPPGSCPRGRVSSRAGDTCRASTPSAWRRTRTTGRRNPAPGPRWTTTPRTCGRCTRWRTSSRWKAASATASSSSPPRPRLVRPATSPSTTGGTWACTTWNSARSTRRSPCTTPHPGQAGPPSGSTWWTPPPCCGGCRCSASTSPSGPSSSRPTSTIWSAARSTSSTTGMR
jgi:hypothetical protein